MRTREYTRHNHTPTHPYIDEARAYCFFLHSALRGHPQVGFRNFNICQIGLEISQNFTEISAQLHLNSKCEFHYLTVAQFK